MPGKPPRPTGPCPEVVSWRCQLWVVGVGSGSVPSTYGSTLFVAEWGGSTPGPLVRSEGRLGPRGLSPETPSEATLDGAACPRTSRNFDFLKLFFVN